MDGLLYYSCIYIYFCIGKVKYPIGDTLPLDIYAENMIRHYEKPHNKGKLDNPSAKIHEDNPTCGDTIDVYLLISENKLKDVKFTGDGCSISLGSASMVTDYVKGKTLQEIKRMGKDELIEVIGINPGAGRMHCATLALKAIKEAIFKYESKSVDESTKEL